MGAADAQQHVGPPVEVHQDAYDAYNQVLTQDGQDAVVAAAAADLDHEASRLASASSTEHGSTSFIDAAHRAEGGMAMEAANDACSSAGSDETKLVSDDEGLAVQLLAAAPSRAPGYGGGKARRSGGMPRRY